MRFLRVIMITSLAYYCCAGLVAKMVRQADPQFGNTIYSSSLFALIVAAVTGVVYWSSRVLRAPRSVWEALGFRVVAVGLHLVVVLTLWVLPFSLTYIGSRFCFALYYEVHFVIGMIAVGYAVGRTVGGRKVEKGRA